jgi:hypothetical protein
MVMEFRVMPTLSERGAPKRISENEAKAPLVIYECIGESYTSKVDEYCGVNQAMRRS